MKAFSPEWYAREQAWIDKCNAAYERAAADLITQGYTRKNHRRNLYPSTFHKSETILVRQLGESTWYSRPYSD